MRSTVSSAPTLRAFSTRASDRISRIASYTLQTSGPAPIAPPVITYGGGHRAGPVMECDLPDTRRCEAVRDGKSVSLTGHHICLNVFHPPTPTRKALRCRGLRVNRCPAGHPLTAAHPESVLPGAFRCEAVRGGKSVSSTGHHICLNVFHPPTPTRKALRCRGLRVNRCPAGHPLTAAHPEFVLPDTRRCEAHPESALPDTR